jgi:DNA-binding response OmpR family regulator
VSTILVIDDDDDVRETILRILSRTTHIVLDASDGAKGMELFRLNTPALVITDIVMPNQEGIETIHQIRKEKPNTRILAISGSNASVDYLGIAEKLGADASLAKPFRSAELLSCVASLLDGAVVVS